jgi:protein-arginine kinase activator protein McsA
MAVRSTIPIFVDEEVMNVGAYEPDSEESDKQEDQEKFGTVADELEKLRQDLQKAVENEDYEKAAELRDKIKKIELGS